MDGLSHLPGAVVFQIVEPPCSGSLPDQLPLKLRSSPHNVEKEAGCGVSIIGVESLGCGDEPHPVGVQLPEIGEAVEQ
jgi:hypothetical protein